MMDSHNTNESDVSHYTAVNCEAIASASITATSNCNDGEATDNTNTVGNSLEHVAANCNSSNCDNENGDVSHCATVKREAVVRFADITTSSNYNSNNNRESLQHNAQNHFSSDSLLEDTGKSNCDSGTTVTDNEDADFAAFCRFAFPMEDSSKTAIGGECDTKATVSEAQPYYFESDHVALKGNVDYRRLLRAFVSLQAERTAAQRDLDRLLEAQHKALSDPISFVNQMQASVMTSLLLLVIAIAV